jgi:chromosome segregation ATPase
MYVHLHLWDSIAYISQQKVSGLKSQLQDLQELYDQSLQDMHAHRARQEELARHIEDLVTEVKREQEARENLEHELDNVEKTHESDIRRERRALEDKDSALRSALDDLSRAQSLLSQRQGDLEAVQNALRDMEQRSKELGETHTTARFSLQLEVDRLKRDVDRLEDELSRTRKDVGDREGTTRDREDLIHRLQLEVQQLTTQLNTQTQARLSLSEKLDSTQSGLKTAEAELFGYRTRVNELETRLSKDQRTLLSTENQYRDQLTERNTLLLTIYQYMDKILGVDKTPVSSIIYL